MNSPSFVPVIRTRVQIRVAGHRHVLDVHPQVRERRAEHLEELDHAVLVLGKACCLLVLDHVVVEHRAEPVEVTGVEVVVRLPHERLVVHDMPPWLGRRDHTNDQAP